MLFENNFVIDIEASKAIFLIAAKKLFDSRTVSGAKKDLFFFKTFIFSSDEYHFATVHVLEYKRINFGDIEFLAFVYALFLWF